MDLMVQQRQRVIDKISEVRRQRQQGWDSIRKGYSHRQ